MKPKLPEDKGSKHQQNSKINQLADLTELTERETEMVVGGWEVSISVSVSGNGLSIDIENSASSGSFS